MFNSIDLRIVAAALLTPPLAWTSSIAVNALRPLETETQARAIAVQVVDSIQVDNKPVVGWSIDASRFDNADVLSDRHGGVVRNCLGGGLPGLCVADPVWRFHFTAPAQSGYSLEASVAIDARSGQAVGQCSAGFSVGPTGAPASPNSCNLDQPIGDVED